MTFKHPAFAKLSVKLERAESELTELVRHLDRHAAEIEAGDWGAVSAAALGVHNIYNGIEDVLLSLAKDIDGLVPSGSSLHQDILDQMTASIDGTRPAVLDARLYAALTELKGFRHMVRHRYGFDLQPDRVQQNVGRIREAFPYFVQAILSLEQNLTRSSH
jgi:uncharacterized protein YutE (UPF0331/DUF86 family)